jgi:hypothetical protein
MGKSLAIWLFETACQLPFLMGLLLLVSELASPGDTLIGDFSLMDVGFLLLATTVFMIGSGYVITTAIAAAVARGRGRWTYPVIVAVLFAAHLQLFRGGLTLPGAPLLELEIGGAAVAFSIAVVGTRRWRAWAGTARERPA